MARQKMPRQAFVPNLEILNSDMTEVAETYEAMIETDIAQPPFDEFDVLVPWHWAMDDDTEEKHLEYRNRIAAEHEAQGKTQIETPIGPIPLDEWRKAPSRKAFVVFRFEGRETTGKWHLWVSFWNKNSVKTKQLPFPPVCFSGPPPAVVNKDDPLEELSVSLAIRAYRVYCTLLVSLVSKGASKQTQHNKAVRLGIGKNTHEYITYLGICTGDSESGDDVVSIDSRSSVRPHLRRGHVRQQPFGTGLKNRKPVFIHPTWVAVDKGYVSNRVEYRQRSA